MPFDIQAATNKIAELELTIVTGPGITRGIENSYDYGENPPGPPDNEQVPAIVHVSTGPGEINQTTQASLYNAIFTIESRVLFIIDTPGAQQMIVQHTTFERELWQPLVNLFIDRANRFSLCSVSGAQSYQFTLPDNSFIRIAYPVGGNNVYWSFRYIHRFTFQNQC